MYSCQRFGKSEGVPDTLVTPLGTALVIHGNLQFGHVAIYSPCFQFAQYTGISYRQKKSPKYIFSVHERKGPIILNEMASHITRHFNLVP